MKVACIICLKTISINQATAGSLYANGLQAFACNDHLLERLRWSITWIAFDNTQRRLAEQYAVIRELEP